MACASPSTSRPLYINSVDSAGTLLTTVNLSALQFRRSDIVASVAAALAASVVCTSPARAQSEASVALSLLPVASVVGVASVGAAGVGALSAAPLVLSAAGAVFTVKVVEVSARGTVYVLERASDGARVSVEVAGRGAAATSLAAGTVVTVSAFGAGLVLSAAGEVIAFIPNAIGRALLHNERVTF